MLDPLVTRLNDLAGADVAVASSEVGSEGGLIHPEHAAIANAIPKRRAEFAAGRRAARGALRLAELPATAIPTGENRAPIWPTGVVGSITHDNGLALACVARSDRVAGLGIDLAEAANFPTHLRKRILRTPAETAATGREARLIFSAKETVFKAFYADVGEYFGFDAVEVTPDLNAGQFEVCFRQNLGSRPRGARFRGEVVIDDTRLVTFLVVPTDV